MEIVWLGELPPPYPTGTEVLSAPWLPGVVVGEYPGMGMTETELIAVVVVVGPS